MGILRSEPMKHGTLVLPIDRARQFIDLVGHSTKMQFEDMNARDMHRPYKKYIQRIDEMERILRFLLDELTKVPGAEVIKNNTDSFLENAESYKLDEVEARLKQIHQDFIQFKENNVKLTSKRNAALEERYVVQTAIASMAQMSSQHSHRPSRNLQDGDQFEFAASRSLLGDEEGGANRRTLETMFSNIAGVIPQAEQDRFARTLWRATRGNTFTHFQQIFEPMQDPKTGREVHKSVFVIYFQDSRPGLSSISAMSEKITKICSSYGVNTYRWPASRENAEEMRLSLQVQVEDQERLLKAHENFVRSEAACLLEPARRQSNSLIEEWRMFCVKEKAIYATLNLFEGHMNLRANCWYPAAEEDEIRRMLIQRSTGHGNSSAMLVSDRTLPRKSPPTYIRKNDFTAPFQDLVDTYGMPSYQEANAALFTIVTFPFLFGVMFGDVGHGFMVLMVGIYAVWKAEDLKYTLPELFYARYMLFMMGFFAVYVGFLYNDIFSLGVNLFTSHWEAATPPPGEHFAKGQVVTYRPLFDTKNEGGAGPYPFGVDPAWHGAQNELVFMNSLKMKLSVILGVAHMILGLLLRFSNALYSKNWVNFFCECIPMMVFMVCFFGFMDIMILYKWVTPMENPPSIINSLISMAMWTPDSNPILGESLPRLLMVITALSVPVMLIPKPVIQMMQHKAAAAQARPGRGPGGPGAAGHGIGNSMALFDEESIECPQGAEEEEEFDIMEVAIHQVIETIEYVLGTVSHTASYLRLWALSLAHQQLSVVFFNMTILNGMSWGFPANVIGIYIFFAAWFAVTIGILLGMDTMECFLHCMRLHWVEFQSKFYKGEGYAFTPFSHRDNLARSEE
mmetsp:Transcript_96759/g.282892  ORF Transcript_96759/g.282892 Transcript_96759/m.282892 type:complete len:850 (+) Transcript_96759:78-2627(+)